MSKETILRKDTRSIENDVDSANNELQSMQSHINWFNSLHYTNEIKTVYDAKSYLTNPVEFHDQQVIKFLQSKVNGEMPPNIEPLKDSWNISEVSEFDYSSNEHFDSLELDEDGQLSYPQSVYDLIESKHTIVATKEMKKTLEELDRLWSNIEKVSEILFEEPGIFREQWMKEAERLLQPLFYKRPLGSFDNGTATRWDVATIELFTEKDFVQSNKK